MPEAPCAGAALPVPNLAVGNAVRWELSRGAELRVVTCKATLDIPSIEQDASHVGFVQRTRANAKEFRDSLQLAHSYYGGAAKAARKRVICSAMGIGIA